MTINPWYVSGFVDGEGYFTIERTYANGKTYHVPVFGIDVRLDDMAIIKDIQSYLGVGRIHIRMNRAYSDRLGNKPQVSFRVRAWKECSLVSRHFDNYPLRAKKSRDYQIWREFVAKGKSLSLDEREAYKSALSRIKVYSSVEEPMPKEGEVDLLSQLN